MDWNWFYSAVAQSMAAIVGVIGAFVVSRTIQRSAEFGRVRETLAELKRNIETQENRLDARRFAWYNERELEDTVRSSTYEDEVLGGRKPNPDIRPLLRFRGFTIYSDLDKAKDRIRKDYGRGVPRRPYGLNLDLPTGGRDLVKLLIEEREMIEQERVRTEALAREISEALKTARAFPAGGSVTRWTIVILSVLFVVGVVYPLSILPVDTEPVVCPLSQQLQCLVAAFLSLKGILLSVIVAVTAVAVWLFWRTESKHAVSDEVLAELDPYVSVSAYSQFLKNHDDWIAYLADETPDLLHPDEPHDEAVPDDEP